jgi:hypothetical protein
MAGIDTISRAMRLRLVDKCQVDLAVDIDAAAVDINTGKYRLKSGPRGYVETHIIISIASDKRYSNGLVAFPQPQRPP